MRAKRLTTGIIALLLSAAITQAVKPQAWTAASKKDFEVGSFAGTVVDSYGQLTLGREMTPIKLPDSPEIVTAFAQTRDGTLYAAVNPDGKIYRITATETKVIYSAPKGFTDITAMVADNSGNLLVALAGKSARVVEVPLTKKAASVADPRFQNENVDNIWAIAIAPDGATYIGTGPHGKIYRLTDDPAGTSVLETPATNITALAFDQNQNLIAGTDAKGLIIRLDLKTKKPFVLLDAGKVDVNAIVTDKAGNIYIATAKTDPDESPDDDAEPNTKSKPGAPEPELIDPPAEDAPPKKGARAPIHLNPQILAANDPGIPPELKKLLDKAAALNEKSKEPPSTKKKSPLPSHDKESSSKHNSAPSHESDESPTDSSAVYRISPEGVVTTLLQESDANFSLLLTNDDLLIGTGNEGKLFLYHLPDQSLTLLARLKEEHITALFAAKDGNLYAGTANMGTVYRIGSNLAKSGTFTSPVLDATNTAVWGNPTLDILPALPPGTKATIATRSGNTRSVENGSEKFWSDWSPEIDSADNKKISSPEARYLQFRITLTSDPKNQTAPVVNKLRIAYQTQNLPPKISAVTISLAGQSSDGDDPTDPTDLTSDIEAPTFTAKIAWDASDPNNDTLIYRVYYRSTNLVDGKEDLWTPITKETKDSTCDWDIRSLADGKYQIKVTASDKPDNTAADAKEVARISAPILIDRTPPVLGDLKASTDGNKATLSGEATDASSAITDIRYQIDAQGDWQPAAPSAKMFDSPHEGFTIVTAPLSTGSHRITVRATDAAANCSYKTATVSVKP